MCNPFGVNPGAIHAAASNAVGRRENCAARPASANSLAFPLDKRNLISELRRVAKDVRRGVLRRRPRNVVSEAGAVDRP